MRKYVWLKAKGYAEPTGITKLMQVASDKVVAGKGPFQLTQDAEPLGEPAERSEVLKRFKTAISGREIGSVFRIRKAEKVAFTARAIQAISQADSTNGNDHSDAYYNWVKAGYRNFNPRYAGSYVCRSIAGSGGTMSQHSYGNAVDFFFDSMTHQTAVANAVIANAALLHPENVISGSRIWSKGSGWGSYGGDFHSHLHVDFDPARSGSCGVKN